MWNWCFWKFARSFLLHYDVELVFLEICQKFLLQLFHIPATFSKHTFDKRNTFFRERTIHIILFSHDLEIVTTAKKMFLWLCYKCTVTFRVLCLDVYNDILILCLSILFYTHLYNCFGCKNRWQCFMYSAAFCVTKLLQSTFLFSFIYKYPQWGIALFNLEMSL